jgi:hypothetical protein
MSDRAAVQRSGLGSRDYDGRRSGSCRAGRSSGSVSAGRWRGLRIWALGGVRDGMPWPDRSCLGTQPAGHAVPLGCGSHSGVPARFRRWRRQQAVPWSASCTGPPWLGGWCSPQLSRSCYGGPRVVVRAAPGLVWLPVAAWAGHHRAERGCRRPAGRPSAVGGCDGTVYEPGRPEESHLRAPTDPCVTVSRYTALAVLVIWRAGFTQSQ